MSNAFVNAGATAASTTLFHRAMAYIDTATRTPDIIAAIGGGASAYASGIQVCIGARPALVP